MLYTLDGDSERDDCDYFNSLMRSNAKSAVGVGVPGRMAVHYLHDSDHHHQRNAESPGKGYQGGARPEFR